jgi:hypothetical protein
MEARADLIQMQLKHLDAVRRLRNGMKTYGRLRGLQRVADYHLLQAGHLARELCGGRQAVAK